MRFDDSLETVLAADTSSPFGAQSAWRQLVDLIGRGRVPASAEAIGRLRAIREQVPPPVRAASARALAFATPPAALVRLFAEDELAIAAPVLRIARLMPHEWVAMLPAMSSANRSILRHRRDLGPTVERALAAFGPSDFVLPAAPMPVEQPVAGRAAALDTVVVEAPEPLFPGEFDAAPEHAEPAHAEQIEEAAGSESPAADEQVPEPPVTEAPPAVPPPAEPIAINWQEVMAARPMERPAVITAPAPVAPPVAVATSPEVPAPVETPVDAVPIEDAAEPSPAAPALPDSIPILPDESTFVSLASVALGLPVVAEALRRADQQGDGEAVQTPTEGAPEEPVSEAAGPQPMAPVAPLPVQPANDAEPAPETSEQDADVEGTGTFQISDIVARIDAYQRHREDHAADTDADAPRDDASIEGFRFETDATGVVRWVAGVSREALIGLSLDMTAVPAGARVDGIASGAFRRRAGFVDARLLVDGTSDAAGQWRITGIPVFDRATGRFTGYRGTGRRPRADERAESDRGGRSPATDAVRQLVHELRTPTTAIAGFAEMIEGELLGPVPTPYRDYATTIRHQASGLLGAIDDLDTAARIDSNALNLRQDVVELQPLLSRIIADLRPLATLRGTTTALFATPGSMVLGDEHAIDRLLGRLTATMLGAGGADETIMVTVAPEGAETIAVTIDRPRALRDMASDALMSVDAEEDPDGTGAPLLGIGFAMRLVRNLAGELGGTLAIGAERLTLRLPAAVSHGVDQASTN